jgi:hypothetical protein
LLLGASTIKYLFSYLIDVVRGLESIELVLATVLMLAFVGGTYYVFYWASGFVGQQQMQADLSAAAQSVLDRVIHHRSYNPLKELGLGLESGLVDDGAVALYALAAGSQPQGQSCTIQSGALADAVGTNQATLVGRGWLYVRSQRLSLDYDAIMRSLFGSVAPDGVTPLYKAYDLWLVVTPLINATCPIDSYGRAELRLFTTYGGRPVDGPVAYTILYARRGGVLCAKSGLQSTQNGRLVVLWNQQLVCDDGSTELPDPTTGTVAVIFEKLVRPSIVCYNTTGRSRPFVYGFVLPTESGPRLYMAHGTTVSCGPGGVPPLDVNSTIYLYWGGSRYRVVSNVVLNPDVGGVDRCSACTSSAGCAACYVDGIPPAARLAVISVQTSAAGMGTDLVIIPLVPYPPLMRVDVRTWLRWGYSQIPEVYSAVATRVVDGSAYSYNVTLILYRRP